MSSVVISRHIGSSQFNSLVSIPWTSSGRPQKVAVLNEELNPITDQLAHAIDESLARVLKGERDPDKMGMTIEEMNRMREELRKRVGVVNVAVDLIRDTRNQ